uniref:Uncharacterized protein n=1 Tax=Setaria italica TaxID=4555 RepID=K3YXI4_SETIT
MNSSSRTQEATLSRILILTEVQNSSRPLHFLSIFTIYEMENNEVAKRSTTKILNTSIASNQ